MDSHFISRFLRGSFASVTGTLLMILCHFVSLKLLAEYMTVEDFGIFILLVVVSRGFEVLSGLGLTLTLVKNMAGESDTTSKQVAAVSLLARSVQLAVLSLLVLAFGRSILTRVFGDSLTELIVYLPAMFCLCSIRDLLFAVLQGKKLFRWHAIIKVLSAVIRLSAILLLSYLGKLGVTELVWVEILTSAATVTALLWLTSAISFLRTENFRLSVLQRVLGFSAPLYANDIFRYVYNRVSVLILGALLAPSSVALYAIATNIPDALGRVLHSFLIVYFPSISELIGIGRRAESQRLMNLALAMISAVLSFVALITFFFQKEIVLILFSDQYIEAAPILALLMLSFILSCMIRLMSSTAVAAGYASVPLRINVITSAVGVAACSLMVPLWGIKGAAYAQIVTNMTAQLLYWYQLNKAQLAIDAGEIFRPLVFGLMIVGLYGVLGQNQIFVRILLIGIYGILCWFLVPSIRRCSEYGFAFLAKLARQPLRAE